MHSSGRMDSLFRCRFWDMLVALSIDEGSHGYRVGYGHLIPQLVYVRLMRYATFIVCPSA